MLVSNNDPKIIANLFVNCVSELGHAPKTLRTDCGTENGNAAAIQSLFHDSQSAHLYGKSTSNQRIEALWSKLRPAVQGWIDCFKQLIHDNNFQQGNRFHLCAIRKSFTTLIKKTLNQFMLYWNTHAIRQSSDSVGGIPDTLFFQFDHCGIEPHQAEITAANTICSASSDNAGDEDIDNYCQYVIDEMNLPIPEDKHSASQFYQTILSAGE